LLKMSLVDRSRDNVFLDSDNLRDLSRLFQIVKNDTETLIVLATRGLLNSPWCVGEITTCCLNNVRCCPVKFPNFVLTIDACLAQLEKHSEWGRLSEAGFARKDIEEALAWMSSFINIHIDELAGIGFVADVVDEVRKHHLAGPGAKGMSVMSVAKSDSSNNSGRRRLNSANGTDAVAPTGSTDQSVGTIVVVDCSNREGLATGLILVKLLRPLWIQEPDKIPVVLDTSVRLPKGLAWSQKTVILVMSVGCFASPRFLTDLLWFAGTRVRGLVPVVTADSFEFPTQSFYEALERQVVSLCREAHVNTYPDLLTDFVESVFERICKRITPHASIETLTMEAKVIWKEVEESRVFGRMDLWNKEQMEVVTTLRGHYIDSQFAYSSGVVHEGELEHAPEVERKSLTLAETTFSV